MYRESGENLLEILAVVIISSPISFAIGMAKTKDCRVLELVRVQHNAIRCNTLQFTSTLLYATACWVF